MTTEGDLVLVYMEGNPAFFARIESIAADVKPEWFQVKMLVLQVPLLTITWIIREAYINGEEFTMGGRPVRLEKVVSPEPEAAPAATEEPVDSGSDARGKSESTQVDKKSKVVSLADRRKKDHSS